MEMEGFVSLWIGTTVSSEELDDYLEISYTEEGNLVPSRFATSFNISRYDEAFREADFYEEPSESLNDLLEGFSYDEDIIPKFKSLIGNEVEATTNAVILLYNFQYDGTVTEWSDTLTKFKYLGTVEYR